MKVAAIVLNYNSSEDCQTCIGYLKKQEGVELEIVVVDNASTQAERDKTERICKETGCTFIQNTVNRGYNAGNNVGLRYAAEHGFPYAMVINPDVQLLKSDIVKLMVEKSEEYTDIVALGTDVISPEGFHQNPRNYTNESWTSSFKWVKELLTKNKKGDDLSWVDSSSESHYCNGLNGCCFLAKVTFLQSIGFFDERTFLYGEEPIFASQIRRQNKKMYYCADIQVFHNHLKSKEGKKTALLNYWKQSRLVYINHHSGYPFYGKWVAKLSLTLYFAMLSIKNKLRK